MSDDADDRRWRLLGTGGNSVRVTGPEIGPYEVIEVVPVTRGQWDHVAAFAALREAVLRIRDGDHPGRSVREALDDALSDSATAGAVSDR